MLEYLGEIYIYIYIYMYICMYKYAHMRLYDTTILMYLYVCIHIYIYMYIYMFICIYISVYIDVYVSINFCQLVRVNKCAPHPTLPYPTLTVLEIHTEIEDLKFELIMAVHKKGKGGSADDADEIKRYVPPYTGMYT
jgi:hypothetical protein